MQNLLLKLRCSLDFHIPIDSLFGSSQRGWEGEGGGGDTEQTIGTWTPIVITLIIPYHRHFKAAEEGIERTQGGDS